MNIFITGWGGFSGSYLASYLLQRGHSVSAISRCKTIPALTKELQSSSFELLYGDINNLTALPKNTDVVIHTASTSPTFEKNISHFIENNILATQKLIDLAFTSHVKKFIFFSSISIYGSINDPEVDEETAIVNPNAYGTSKLFGELCLREYSDQLPSIALRLPAIVGLGAHRHWLATTLEKALKSETIEAFNFDSPFNNAIHIKDLGLFVNQLLSYPIAGFNPITLAADGNITIKSILNKIKVATNSSSKIISVPKTCTSFTISIKKAKKDFQYIPRSFEDTLDLYLKEQICHVRKSK